MKTGEVLLIIVALIGALVMNGCTSNPGDPGAKEPILCPADMFKCPNGASVSRDPDNNCEFKVCPDKKEPIVCPGDMFKCPDNSLVSRDPDNDCKFKTCPTTETIKAFDIKAKQFTFEPDTITVKKGDTVRLTVTSVDVAHGIGIPEFNVNLKVAKGETNSVEFVADKAGTYTIRCNVFCGSDHKNMKATLVVEA